MTEETGRELVAAMKNLTEAIKSGAATQASQAGQAYVAASIVGGIEAAKAENKRNRVRRTKR